MTYVKNGWKTKILDEEVKKLRRRESVILHNSKKKQINFSVNPSQFNALKRLAKTDTLSVPAYCRCLVLSNLDVFFMPKVSRKAIAEINKIGNNINQIQRMINIHNTDNLSMIVEFAEELNILNHKFGDVFMDIYESGNK